MGFNKVILLGNMAWDPELKQVGGGTVCNFRLGVTRKYKTRDGQDGEDTAWVDVEMWGTRGEVISKWFRKGDPILIEGRLRYREWEQDGQKRNRLSVTADNFEFLPKRGASGDGSSAGGGYGGGGGGGYGGGGGGYSGGGGGYGGGDGGYGGGGGGGGGNFERPSYGDGPSDKAPIGDDEVPF